MAAKRRPARRTTRRAAPKGAPHGVTHPLGYYREPTIAGDRIVFVSDDDLWAVGREGGLATRLTAGDGKVGAPRLSPDGQLLAFTADYDGGFEAYVMPAEGGTWRRLTWLGGITRTVGWRADGKSVLVISNADQPFPNDFRLHEVPLDGSPSKPLPLGPARALAEEPGGKGRVLGLNTGDPARWKRYRGGTRGRLLVDREGKGAFEPLLDSPGNLSSPMWIGKRIWFLSDHEGHANLYSCTPTGRSLTRHTDHEGLYARMAATDGQRIVYHLGADLWVHDLASDTSSKIDVRIASPRTQRTRRYVPAAKYMESASLHPQGHSVAVVTRGGTWTMALWEGAPRRHGETSSERQRMSAWLPDGERFVTVSDADGEERLVVAKASGEGRPKRLRADIGRVLDMAVAPAGADRVAVANHRQEVLVVDLATGRAQKVASSPFHRIGGLAWSPDGRWLAFGLAESHSGSSLKLYDTKDAALHDVTNGDFFDGTPAFDPDGKYLAFLSGRVFDPVYDSHYFDLGFPRGFVPCLVPLAADAADPFAPGRKDAKPVVPGGGDAKPAPTKKGAGNAKKKPGPEPVRVDLKDIARRVLAFPVPEARYEGLVAVKNRFLFLSVDPTGSLDDAPASAPRAELTAYDLEAGERQVFGERITDVEATADGRHLLLRVGDRLRVLAGTTKPKEASGESEPSRKTGWLDLGRLKVEVNPALEWEQMFHEAWRLQRDQFWTADMAGVDWQAVHERYHPLVARVSTRSEFSDLMWEMQGELGTSHCYEMGGEYAPGRSYPVGRLGADIAWDSRLSAWRITRLPQGDTWSPGGRSPLAAPGLGIQEGDLITAIDGKALDRKTSPAAALVHRARSDVAVTVRRGAAKPRTVVVRTLGSEHELRYRDWVERNRAYIHKVSKGRVGYVHVPDMGPRGFSEFHRYYRGEARRDGLVVDVRYNGGGHVSQLLLEKLLRRRIGYDRTRWMGVMPYPQDATTGCLVALTNEHAGSDGDIFSHSWKIYGLGPLIGRRTWGGVVGIWPRHALVDGTVTTQPEFAYWFQDVGYAVENYGTDPDIPVDIMPADHAAGRDPQLERAWTEMKRLLGEKKPALPTFGPVPSMAPPRLPRRS